MDKKQPWENRVQGIIVDVNRRGKTLMCLGYLVYGIGSALILWLVHDKGLATVLVMYLFQLMMVYMGAKEMYPCIAGGFRASLEASRDSVPLFEKIAEGVEALERDPESHPVIRAVGERVEKAVSARLSPVIDTWTRLGERLEKVVIPQFEATLAQMSEASKKIDGKVSSTVEGVKRVQQHLEGELATGIMTEIREATSAIKLMAAPHAPAPMMDFKSALNSLSRPPIRNGAAIRTGTPGASP